MDAKDTQKYYKKYSLPRGALYGAVGGLVAAWVMAPFLMITMILLGFPEDVLFITLGGYVTLDFADSFQAGIIMHIMSGVIIGTIFGVMTAAIERLRITSFAKGVGTGLAAGGIIFAVFFVPLAVTTLPALVDAIIQNGQGISEEQRSDLEAQVFIGIMVLGAFDHLAYGAVLGVVTSGFIVGVRKITKVEK
jgi:hypothetical protein